MTVTHLSPLLLPCLWLNSFFIPMLLSPWCVMLSRNQTGLK